MKKVIIINVVIAAALVALIMTLSFLTSIKEPKQPSEPAKIEAEKEPSEINGPLKQIGEGINELQNSLL